MSSPCRETEKWSRDPLPSRRDWLRRTGATLGAAAVGLAGTAVARAACPCAGDDDDPKDPKDRKDAPPEKPDRPAAAAPATQPTKVLKVCADPNNLPFSNHDREGFEDKIAALIARDLGLELQYQYLPQRLGFFREALKHGDANVVMAVPAGFERAATSVPYYRSTYVFVTRKENGQSGGRRIRSLDDPVLREVKIGVPLAGGTNTPPTHALARRKLIDNVTGYPIFDASDGKPGEKIIAAVASGEIDVAIAWGPPAGYFARKQSVPLEVTPVSPEEEAEGDVTMQYTFNICVGVRRSEKALKARIDEALGRRKSEIEKILDEYGVPRLPVKEREAGGKD